MDCARRDELAAESQQALEQIIQITIQAREALRQGNQAEMLRTDRALELALGEKERLIGALREHKTQHGC